MLRTRQRHSQPAPAPTAEQLENLRLMGKGGNYWSNQDKSKKRIYFNMVNIAGDFFNGYFDCIERTWHVERERISVEKFIAAIEARSDRP